MPDWVWLEPYKRYRDLDSGRWASSEKVREWSTQATTASVDVISELSDMLVEERLNTHDWMLLMRDEIKDCLLYTSPSPRDRS